jgi:solute carrier family 24 (sodium/potassium/calcium exchanger), member 6
MPSFSLIGALEFRQVVASLQNQAASTSLSMFDNPLTPYLRGHYPHHHYHHSWSRPRTPVHADEVDPWDAALGVPLSDRSPTWVPDDITDLSQSTSTHAVSHTPPSPSETDAESQQYIPPTKTQRVLQVLFRTCHILFPTLRCWQDKTFIGKVVALFAAPAVMALTLTLPVVVMPYRGNNDDFEKSPATGARLIDFEEEGVEIERALIAEEEVEEERHELTFNKWLMAVQSVLGPLFCVGVLFSESPVSLIGIRVFLSVAQVTNDIFLFSFFFPRWRGTHVVAPVSYRYFRSCDGLSCCCFCNYREE